MVVVDGFHDQSKPYRHFCTCNIKVQHLGHRHEIESLCNRSISGEETDKIQVCCCIGIGDSIWCEQLHRYGSWIGIFIVFRIGCCGREIDNTCDREGCKQPFAAVIDIDDKIHSQVCECQLVAVWTSGNRLDCYGRCCPCCKGDVCNLCPDICCCWIICKQGCKRNCPAYIDANLVVDNRNKYREQLWVTTLRCDTYIGTVIC